MATPVVSVQRRTTLDEALEQMLRRHVSGLPVVDSQNQPVGVVSEADILRLYIDERGDSVLFDPCEAHMSTELLTVEESDPLDEAAQLMLIHNVRRLLVVLDGKLVGVLARRDIVRCIRDDQRLRAASVAIPLP